LAQGAQWLESKKKDGGDKNGAAEEMKICNFNESPPYR